MQEAAERGDLQEVSTMAFGALGLMESATFLLQNMESWAPADDVVETLTSVAQQYTAALTLIDEGAMSGDLSILEEGWRQAVAADELASRAADQLADLQVDTGFSC